MGHNHLIITLMPSLIIFFKLYSWVFNIGYLTKLNFDPKLKLDLTFICIWIKFSPESLSLQLLEDSSNAAFRLKLKESCAWKSIHRQIYLHLSWSQCLGGPNLECFEVYTPLIAGIEHAVACSDIKPSSHGFLMLWHLPQSILNSTLISEPSFGF